MFIGRVRDLYGAICNIVDVAKLNERMKGFNQFIEGKDVDLIIFIVDKVKA